MLVVTGWLRIRDERRDSYLHGCLDAVRAARSAPGCLEYTLAADPIEADRIVVLERWSSPEALHAFRGDGPSEGQLDDIVEADVRELVVTSDPS